VDVGDEWPDGCEKAIVCTPTSDHLATLVKMQGYEGDILCEKPLVMGNEIDIGFFFATMRALKLNVRMVCNWAFTAPNFIDKPESRIIEYDNYNTGKDGMAWDCIQLIYIAKGFPILKTKSPFLDCKIDGERVDEADIAYSYVAMIEAWLKDPTNLWSLEDAKKATEKVMAYEAMVASRPLP
jgi:hypothetical protein